MAKIPKIPLGGPIQVGASIPSVDAKYGPYASKQDAMDALGEDGMDVICIGLTIGIIEDNNIVEYWFQGGTSITNLVKKGNDDNNIVTELSRFAKGDVIPIHAAKTIFTYNDEAVYKVPCIYDDANCILACCNIIENNIEIIKVYLIAGKNILNVWNDNNIPNWVIPYIPKRNVQILTEIQNTLNIQVD